MVEEERNDGGNLGSNEGRREVWKERWRDEGWTVDWFSFAP